MNKDDLSKALCRKWKLSYVVTDGMQLPVPPDKSFIYEFKSDNSFTMKSGSEIVKGTWNYNSSGKFVYLNVNNIQNTTITSLTNEVLTAFADTKKAMPDDPTGIKMVFVPSN